MFCALVGRVEGVIEIWTSRVQKQTRVFNEEPRVLVVRAVIGVGIDDQLRIRHVLLHDEREDRGYVHVVTAVHDEGWLLDRLQIVGGPLLLDAPLANRFDLGGRHLVVHFGIAALLTTMRALQVLPSRRLARRGRTEFDREPDTLGRIVGVGAKEPPCSLGYRLHSLTAARTCAIDDHPANEIGRLQSDFLHDQAADREAKYVNLLQAQRLDEGDGVGGHLLERRRDLAGAAGDARVVEQDHLTVASEAMRHHRVPVIHGADVVLVEDERHAAGLAESAIGEADSVSLNELCRRGLVAVLVHRGSLSRWLLKLTCETVEAGSFRAWTGSVGAVPAVDIEDVTRDESGFVRRNEDNTVGALLGGAEPTQRNLRRQGRLVLRRTGEAGQHAGVGGARCYGIHANSRLGGFERHRLGDAFDGVLGADVDRGPGRALVPIGRGDVDDAAASLGLHGAHFVLHAQYHAEYVGLEGRGKAFRGLVRDRADRTFGGGIVHRDIETAKACDGLVDHGTDVILLADVGADEFGLGTQRT